MSDTDRPEPPVTELDLEHATGTWAIRSSSATVYYLDLGTAEQSGTPYLARARLLRQPGPGSPTGPWDGCWLPLIDLYDDEQEVRVRVGHRHHWTMDPGPAAPDIWWWQRTVTAIQPVAAADRPQGREPAASEDQRPFRHGA